MGTLLSYNNKELHIDDIVWQFAVKDLQLLLVPIKIIKVNRSTFIGLAKVDGKIVEDQFLPKTVHTNPSELIETELKNLNKSLQQINNRIKALEEIKEFDYTTLLEEMKKLEYGSNFGSEVEI